MNKRVFGLMLGIFFTGLAVGLVVAVMQKSIPKELASVFMLIAGAATMASLTALTTSLQSGHSRVVNIHFNEALANEPLRKVGADVIDADFVLASEVPGELTAASLIGKDNTLALAKLRIDLERELSSFAARHGINFKTPYQSPTRMIEELARREMISRELVPVWRDVLSAANRAVHGGTIATDTADSVVRVGEKLIASLRSGKTVAYQR